MNETQALQDICKPYFFERGFVRENEYRKREAQHNIDCVCGFYDKND